MASHPNHLADIGREGFALVDRFFGGGKPVRAPKKQYRVLKNYASVTSNENIIDSKMAAEKYKGTVVSAKEVGQRF